MGNSVNLSYEEVLKLRELLEVADIVKSEAQYKAAVKLVLKSWKNAVIGAAAMIAALILLKEHLADALQSLIR